MSTTFVLSADSAPPQAIGSPTIKDGIPTQRFMKKVMPAGRFTKREKGTGRVLWSEDFKDSDLQQFAKAFTAMKEKKIPVRLKDETGNFTLDMPNASPLTTDHAGVFDKDRKRGLKTMVNAIIADTAEMYVDPDDGWLTTLHDVQGEKSIDAVRRGKFTSPEIEECFIDGESKEYGRCIRAISIVANPLIPNQPEFQAIAASDDSPVVYVMSLDPEDAAMPNAALFAVIATLAGVEVSKVTDATAADLLKGVQTRVTADADRLRVLSEEEHTAPSRTELRACAKLGMSELSRLEAAGVVSKAGLDQLGGLLVGDVAKLEYSPLIMSADEPDDAAVMLEKLVDIILKNPGLKKGSKTVIQDPKAMSEEEANGEGSPKPLSPEREKELMAMSATGRELLRSK